jgi:hypothetical protein
MAYVVSCIVMLIVGLIESWIFSLPIRIPFIKRLAINHHTFRWTAIILLGIAPIAFNGVGLIWLGNYGNISDAAKIAGGCSVTERNCISEAAGFETVFDLDYALRDELVKEVTLRTLYAGNSCVSDRAAVCAAADYWQIHEAEEQAAINAAEEPFTVIKGFFVMLFMGIFLAVSGWTGYIVHRLTRDTAKSKYLA